MLLALALVELLVTPFAAFLDADIALNYFGSDGVLLPAIGADPAGRDRQRPLSRLLPVPLPAGAGAQGQPVGGRDPGLGRLRAVSSSLQFAVSIGLIICTAVIYGQTVFARTVDPGYKRDHILQVEELGARPALSPRPRRSSTRSKRFRRGRRRR